MNPNGKNSLTNINEICIDLTENLDDVITQMKKRVVRGGEQKMNEKMWNETFYKKNIENPMLSYICYENLVNINYFYLLFYMDRYIKSTSDFGKVYRVAKLNSLFKKIFKDQKFYEFLSDKKGFLAKIFLEQIIEYDIFETLKNTELDLFPIPDIYFEQSDTKVNPSRIKKIHLSINKNVPIELGIDVLFYKEISKHLDDLDEVPTVLIDNFYPEISQYETSEGGVKND
jgi:hypothetical protein